MRQKLTDIETALKRIDSATFQRLCDEYLFCRHGALYRHIIRTGTQPSKMQSVKGTPDTYVVLSTGKYVLIEYTTQQTDLVGKLQEDISKCLDINKTGLRKDQIQRIIIGYTGKLTIIQDREVRDICDVELEIIGLDELALSIHNDFPQLARRYLDISYETFQLQTPEEFIAEHIRKAVGDNNPLSNPLRHRENELSVMLDRIECQDITVLTGGQGVGKTRLALEVLHEFNHKHPDYEPICIANKFAPLLEDLNDFVQPKKKYIFLIDDANRQTPVLLQTLEYLYAKPDVSFKIILTVRDYALDTVKKHLQPYRWDFYTIEKFTNDQIVKLIDNEPFNIGHHGFQQRIVDLANGNPRLAIMAAKLALKEQNLYALNDATDLYINYYDNLTDSNNKSLLEDELRMKVLGIIAVFRQIDLLYEPFIKRITTAFEISRDSLVEELASLEKDELVDMYLTDQSLFRLSDQNLATYAIYQAFIDKKLISTEALMTEFFGDFPSRIRDSFYGVINAFNHERIVNDIKKITYKYYHSVLDEDSKAFEFFKIFFIVLPTETIDYLLLLNEQLPARIESWKKNDKIFASISGQGHLKGRLNLLFNFFSGFNDNFDTALELLVKFAENPLVSIQLLSDLIMEKFSLCPEDANNYELRQTRLIRYLMEESKSGNEVTRRLLFSIIPFFLKFEFRSTRSRGLEFTITTTPFSVKEPFGELHHLIWEFIECQFLNYLEECQSILLSYNSSPTHYKLIELWELDNSYIIPLIEKYLNPLEFNHCVFVNKYRWHLNRNGLQNTKVNLLGKQFSNKEYTLFLLLDWTLIPGRDMDFEIKQDVVGQVRLKKYKEIDESIKLNSLPEIVQIFDDIFCLIGRRDLNTFGLNDSIEAILEIIKKKNAQLFKQGIEVFSQINWPDSVKINRILGSLFNHKIEYPEDWYDVFKHAMYRKTEWIMTFFSLIMPSAINIEWFNKFINYLKEEPLNNFYHDDIYWQNYMPICPRIYSEVLNILTNRYETTGMRYSLDNDFFKDRIAFFNKSDIPLLKKVYLQLFEMNGNSAYEFDCFLENLKVLLLADPAFIVEFIEAHYRDKDKVRFGHPKIKNLAIIWSLPNAVIWALEIVKVMKNQNICELYGSNYEPFFEDLNDENKVVSIDFLNDFFKLYANDAQEIDNMVQALLHIGRYEEWRLCIRVFLTNNKSLDDFKKISWTPNSISGSGNINFEQIRADRLREVLIQVRAMPKKLPYIQHVKYLELQITRHEEAAERERRRQFGEDD